MPSQSNLIKAARPALFGPSPLMCSQFLAAQEVGPFSLGLGFWVLTRLTHIFQKWQREKAGREIWGLLLLQRALYHLYVTLCFIGGTLSTCVDPHSLSPLLRKHFTLVRVGESRSDPGRSFSRSCNLTVHSTFCIRGMFGPAASESLRCTASNARLGRTSAVEETPSPSNPPLLNIWMTCCFNLPVSYNHFDSSAS